MSASSRSRSSRDCRCASCPTAERTLVDLVLGVCAEAGFTPTLADHPEGVENLVVAIASGPPTWTVLYEPHVRMLQQSLAAFRLTDPPQVMSTAPAVREDATSRSLAPLLRACAAAAGAHPSKGGASH